MGVVLCCRPSSHARCLVFEGDNGTTTAMEEGHGEQAPAADSAAGDKQAGHDENGN